MKGAYNYSKETGTAIVTLAVAGAEPFEVKYDAKANTPGGNMLK